MTLEQDIAAHDSLSLSLENDALIEENKRLKDIIGRAIPSIGFHWSMTAGGPRKSNLLALRREAEDAAGPLKQSAT